MMSSNLCEKYDLFIFDWDGTLMDTTQPIIDALVHSCKHFGFEIVSDDAARSIMGKNFVQVVDQIIPELRGNPDLLQKFVAINARYLDDNILQSKFFNGVDKLIQGLLSKGKLLAIATGRDRRLLNETLQYTGYGKYFMITKTASECSSKPNPQMIEEILDFTNTATNKAVMIGDTTYDIIMAHNAQIDSIAVCEGAHSEAELITAKPNVIYDDILDLYKACFSE